MIVNGKEYKFTIRTMIEFCNRRGCKFSEYDSQFSEDPFASISDLLLCANKVAERGKEMTIYEVDDEIQKMTNEDLQKLMDEHAEGLTSFMVKFQGGEKKK